MNIQITSLEKVKIIRIQGELNTATSAEAETKIHQLILGGNHHLIVDLGELDYISSAGLRIFLSANRLIKKSNGEIRFCNFNKTVHEVFQISGFLLIFKYFPDLGSAINDLHSS